MASCSITSWQIEGEKVEAVTDLFSWAPKSLRMVTAAMIKCLLLGRKAMTNLDSILKSRDTPLPTKVCIVKAMDFSVVMYRCELNHKGGWTPKNWCFELWCWRRLLRVPRTARRSKQSVPKGNQPWIFIGRTDAEAPILWSPDVKSWLIGKDLDAGKDWGQEEKRATEDEMVGWHHWLNEHELEQTLGLVDREAWHPAIHGVTKSQTQLSD